MNKKVISPKLNVVKNIGFFLAMISLILSCKKENPVNQSYQSQPDNILYRDFQPDTTVHSVHYFYPNWDPESCGDTPVPNDSSAALSIDIDGDAVNDFTFGAAHVIGWSYGSAHCIHIIYSISVAGINPGDSISFIHPQYVDVPVDYDTISNNIINHSALWKAGATLSIHCQGIYYPPYADFEDTYIGVKVNHKYGWIHVAPSGLNGVVVKECAINLTDYNSIKAGQTH